MARFRLAPFVFLISLLQCSSQKEEIIAEIDGEAIPAAEVDGIIQNRLYAKLYEVYKIRLNTLEEILGQKLIEKEAVSRHISVDSLIKIEVYDKLSDAAMAQMIEENDLTRGVPDPMAPGKIMDLKSDRTKEHLKGVFFRKTKRDLIERLKVKYHTRVMLYEPLPPPFDLSKISSHRLNESKSLVEIIIVSDFNCSMCREEYPVIKDIVEKYKDRVSFKLAHLSDSVSFSMLFTECASREASFYNIFKAMFESIESDTINYIEVSQKLNLNESAIRSCVHSRKEELTVAIGESLNELKRTGIVYTPTLLIDNREYFGTFDVKNISEYIDRILRDKE
ncbi:MAG TPA: thioredoxin domain-containing protein [Cyclobacteriaceae bacterium]|nr:DsbA family protein [Cyclobacteriaceae bacterium]HMV07411.1 thioredoxin domain-containing protein [Cyclobacteriaceae bacterium]HMV88985.1 thioredoxin domain-containing protein [Cyclobacteriaceae bacterium]HMW99234.1 thioredoxin domain-containing protein [Cyclobacteriaceae bacterium]HMX48977.1 thioredoxin domain-containing protein [Cyclobacteriaceae bacterium]